MLNLKKILLFVTFLCVLFSFQIADAQGPNPRPPIIIRGCELIQAVNALRLANGVPALTVHPILMQIAQTEVEGIAAGMNGHWRPNNLTLGQWLLSLGYPLSGDLSLDGYRSENWIMGPGLTVQDAVQLWNGDDPHLNTMLSPNRSDIGAGVATSIDEWGQTVYLLCPGNRASNHERSNAIRCLSNPHGDCEESSASCTAMRHRQRSRSWFRNTSCRWFVPLPGRTAT